MRAHRVLTWLLPGFCGLVAISGVGCNESVSPDGSDPSWHCRDHLSIVGSVTAPDTVASGTSFDVAILTWGTSGCWRQGHDRVDRPDATHIMIQPFDQDCSGDDATCTDNMVPFQHVVPTKATAQGTLTIQVMTRLHSVSGKDSVGVIEKSVYVH